MATAAKHYHVNAFRWWSREWMNRMWTNESWDFLLQLKTFAVKFASACERANDWAGNPNTWRFPMMIMRSACNVLFLQYHTIWLTNKGMSFFTKNTPLSCLVVLRTKQNITWRCCWQAKLSLPQHDSTVALRRLRATRYWAAFGGCLGITIWCLLAMLCLPFMDTDRADKAKQAKELQTIFRSTKE